MRLFLVWKMPVRFLGFIRFSLAMPYEFPTSFSDFSISFLTASLGAYHNKQ